MNKYFKYAGGVKLGRKKEKWSTADLHISHDELILNVGHLEKYSFRKDQVTGIKNYRRMPFMGWGVKIEHNVPSYPDKLVFWSTANSNTVIEKIKNRGFFVESKNDEVITGRNSQRSQVDITMKSYPLFSCLLVLCVVVLTVLEVYA